jgi:6-phosphogluconolactonase
LETEETSMFVYVGSYTEAPYGEGPGISVFRFDGETGGLTPLQTVGGVANPSFLTAATDGRFVVATNEQPEGGVTALARDAETGELRVLNREASHGADPCYVSVDPSGRYALVANYSGGTVAVLPIGSDGRLGAATDVVRHAGSSVRADRQGEPHPHMIAPSPDGGSIVVPDLGADAILSYGFDGDAGKLVARPERTAKAAPGSGPRHFAFAPDGTTVYVLNELTAELTACAWADGVMTARQTVPGLPAGYEGEPSGRTCWCRRTGGSCTGRSGGTTVSRSGRSTGGQGS